MVEKLRENPEKWKEAYNSKHVSRTGAFGFYGFKRTEIVLVDRPEELNGLEKDIEKFVRDRLKNTTLSDVTEMKNPVYGVKGPLSLSMKGDALVVKTFECSIAEFWFRNMRKKEENENLTPGQRNFLDNYFLALGVSAYIESNIGYLMGVRDGDGVNEGMLEIVSTEPVFLSYGREGDFFHDAVHEALEKEADVKGHEVLQAETVGINVDPKKGELDLIARVNLKPEKVQSEVRRSKAHKDFLFFMGREKLGKMIESDGCRISPYTAAIFNRLLK